MSPLLLRRYRADRLLREEFESLRGRVLATVSARLRDAGVMLDHSDLEAAYGQAWQGLHAAVLEGQQIFNPAGWLALVTYRRAIDDHRARGRLPEAALETASQRAAAEWQQRDLASELDDRARLRALLESWRLRLSERERQAAALCYLQGLSRAEAAARMGISEARMRKLMDGARGLRGVAAKVGSLAQAIAAGEWCKEQGSLMRGFAFGILDPRGERHRLALHHSEQCSACRAYVLSLRGLAAALPPVPSLLHWALGAGAGAAAGGGLAHAGGGVGGGAASGAGAPAVGAGGMAGASASSGIGAGALSASGAAGAAGGGWWLAGGIGAKLAVGCLLALGVGAGCVALEAGSHGSSARSGRHIRHWGSAGDGRVARAVVAERLASATSGAPQATKPGAGQDRESQSARARREFGPEAGVGSSAATAAVARRVDREASARAARVEDGSATGAAVAGPKASSQAAAGSSSTTAATREFAPG